MENEERLEWQKLQSSPMSVERNGVLWFIQRIELVQRFIITNCVGVWVWHQQYYAISIVLISAAWFPAAASGIVWQTHSMDGMECRNEEHCRQNWFCRATEKMMGGFSWVTLQLDCKSVLSPALNEFEELRYHLEPSFQTCLLQWPVYSVKSIRIGIEFAIGRLKHRIER